jgi:hypothetical protein
MIGSGSDSSESTPAAEEYVRAMVRNECEDASACAQGTTRVGLESTWVRRNRAPRAAGGQKEGKKK